MKDGKNLITEIEEVRVFFVIEIPNSTQALLQNQVVLLYLCFIYLKLCKAFQVPNSVLWVLFSHDL